MFERLAEKKVLRDPIHEYIHIDLKIVWDCLNTPEFQRLRRIHQLGPTYQVYHTAEHSRFSHSLGVYEIARRLIEEVEGLKDQLSEYEQTAVLLAALLHDLGHGPFSHTFEAIHHYNHEEYSQQLILNDSHIYQVLHQADSQLPQTVADIIGLRHSNRLLTQMISGQLDADRMDYLLRDAYFTGTSYGQFDLERIIRTIRIVDHRLVVKESGIHTVEDYIMARYHMYWQVYYHPVSRSFEAVFSQFFHRLKDLYEMDSNFTQGIPMFTPFLQEKPLSNRDILKMDEASCLYGISVCTEHDDEILADLAKRILNRNLFDYANITDSKSIENKKRTLIQRGFDPDYYFWTDQADQRPYQPYQGKESSLIWIWTNSGECVELTKASVIVDAIVKGKNKSDRKMFFPKECI